MYIVPSLAKLVEEGLDLVDADGDVAGVIEPLPLGNASEDVVKVADQLGEGEADLGLLHCHSAILVALRAALN